MTFRVLSYNVGVSSSAAKLSPVGLEKIDSGLGAADAAFFQEACPRISATNTFDECPQGLQGVLREALFDAEYAAVVASPDTVSQAVPTYEAEELSDGASAKYLERKSQEVTATLDGVRVLFLNHHNRAGTQGTAPEYRRRAVSALARRAECALASGLADVSVLLGDFNVPPEGLEQLLGDKWQCEHERGERKTNLQFHWASAAVLSLQPCRVEKHWTPLRWGRDQVSDAHAALLFTVRVPRRGQTTLPLLNAGYTFEPEAFDTLPPPAHASIIPDCCSPPLWQRFRCPGTSNFWWHLSSEEFFFEGDASWTAYQAPGGERWWCHCDGEKWFFEATGSCKQVRFLETSV